MANFNLNKVIVGGRLTADPELKTTPNGVSVVSFSVAVNRKVGKDKEPVTDFLNVVAWRGTADFVSKYFRKGSSICVVGSLQVRKWQDKDGGNRYATEIVADEVHFVDGKNEQGGAYVPDAYNVPQMEEVDTDEDLPF
ncbi:MAG: single-stranded DNA-binding protein [Clostridia bacterium]|nr:single-stranded DNA-binding protein [Clostridia bacterium]